MVPSGTHTHGHTHRAEGAMFDSARSAPQRDPAGEKDATRSFSHRDQDGVIQGFCFPLLSFTSASGTSLPAYRAQMCVPV